jgi:NDP-4-keto-2,6-dideoxyhexose 3-C-methyltransferase
MKRSKCVVCKNDLLKESIIIGEQYPSAIFANANEDYRETIKSSSLNLTKCSHDSCGLVQLSEEYNLDLVFKNYPYVSGTTATMKDILKDVIDEGAAVAELGPQDVVLDIGGNDGTMLSYLKSPVAHKVNMDAASGIGSVPVSGSYQKIEGHFSSDVYRNLDLKKPKIIFTIAMFYHLNDPRSFCEEVKSIMADDSTWVIQMAYLGQMLENNVYDNIVHEHNTYYSLKSLEYLLNDVGLYVCGAKTVEAYGGSIRVYIRKQQEKITHNNLYLDAINIHATEEASGINTNRALELFNERTQTLKTTTYNLLKHIYEKNGKIVALGASTKGNMICQFIGADRDIIECVLDNNDKKIGKIMTGTDIPIVEERLWLDKIPEYLFVLPYYYTDFFKGLIAKNTPKNKSTYLIVPLPNPHVVKVEGLK